LLVTVNDGLILEIEIVHDPSCHPVYGLPQIKCCMQTVCVMAFIITIIYLHIIEQCEEE